MTFLSDLAAHLAAASTSPSLTVGTNLFIQSKPDSPSTCVILYETGDQSPSQTFGSGAPAYEHRGVQAVTRASGHADAESLAREVFDVMNLIVNETVGSTVVLRCEAKQSPFPLRRDSQHRMEFVCNYSFSVL